MQLSFFPTFRGCGIPSVSCSGHDRAKVLSCFSVRSAHSFHCCSCRDSSRNVRGNDEEEEEEDDDDEKDDDDADAMVLLVVVVAVVVLVVCWWSDSRSHVHEEYMWN